MDRRKSKMPEKRVARSTARGTTPPPSSRTRSKSPARDKSSGRSSAAIVKRGRPKKTDTPSDETSSQSSTPVEKMAKPTVKKTPTIVLDDSEDNEEVSEINKRSTRLATLRKRLTPVSYKVTPTPSQEKRSISRSVSSLTKEDSEDEVEIVETQINLGIFTKPVVVVLLLELLAFLPIALQFVFNGKLSFTAIISDLKSSATYCNTQAGSFTIAFLSSTVLCSLIPVGRVVTLPGSDSPKKFNGIVSAVMIVAFLVGLELRGLDALTAIFNNIDRFLFLSIIVNFSIAVYLYVRARRQSSIKSGRVILDFSNGLEINPTIFGRIDIKAISHVRSLTLILIINIALLFKNVSIPNVEASSGLPIGELIKETFGNFVFIVRNAEYNCAALVVSGLLVLYALDSLIYEHHLAASYQCNSEGCGAEILLRFATFPFLLSFLPRFLLAKKLEVNCYLLAVVAVIFMIGLVIKRCSSCLKYEYRLRPADAKFKDLKTLPTLQNHRLIISRWWSQIRQPNLFGEILLHLVLLVPLAVSCNCPALVGILFIVVYLIYRSILINRKNAQKYESSWQRYTTAIKYNLLPRVY